MKRTALVVPWLAVLVVGCGSIDLREHMLTGEDMFATVEQGTKTTNPFGTLKGLADALREKRGAAWSTATVFPSAMRSEEVIKQLVRSCDAAATRSPEHFTFSKGDVESFMATLHKCFGLGPNGKAPSLDIQDTDVGRRAIAYLAAYFSTGFVDRAGVTLCQQEIRRHVGNETLIPIWTVVLEAAFDELYRTPVWYVKKNGKREYLTIGHAVPTAAVYQDGGSLADEATENGISEQEVAVIRFVATLSGELGRDFLGGSFRSYADWEAGYGVSGHFSIGDNDTFALFVDTLCELASRRTTEAMLWKALDGPGPSGRTQHLTLSNSARNLVSHIGTRMMPGAAAKAAPAPTQRTSKEGDAQ